MHFPERVYGTENELGLTRVLPDGTFQGFDDGGLPITMLPIAIKHIPNSIHCYTPGHPRIWHSNGGSTYVDTGYHPEHSTPECRSIRDAVRYNKAGEFLAAQVFHEPMSPLGKLLLFKNNIGLDSQGRRHGDFGAHENYMVYRQNIIDPKEGSRLIPFLITRQIIDGAGLWSREGYSFSQRAHAVTKEFGSGTTSDRPIINTKATADTGDQVRLHLILGDANILEFATYLKIGTTALVLNLIEGGQVPQIVCTNCVKNMEEVCTHYDTLEPLVELLHTDGTKDKKSAYDVQVIYLEAAKRELKSGSFDSEETEAELKHVATSWEQTLNAIYNRDRAWMLGRLDHVTKKYLGECQLRRSMPDDPFSTLKDIETLYHGITDRTFQNRLNGAWSDRRLLRDEEVADAMINPPAHTRAICRSQYINLLIEYGIKKSDHIDWTDFKNDCTFPEKLVFRCPHPLKWDKEKFEAFLENVRARYDPIKGTSAMPPEPHGYAAQPPY